MKTVMISGAGGGLGRAVCRYFLERDWHVHAGAFSPEEADKLRIHLDMYTDRLCVIVADLAKENEARDFVRACNTTPSAFVHLVGGIRAGTPLEECSPEDFDAMLNMNLRTTYMTLRAVLPRMKPHGGAVVTIGSRAVEQAEAHKAAYAASKAAVAALTRSIAEEGKEHGLRANCILPGIIRTEANMEWGGESDIEKWTPPEDIAAAIYHLCSPESRGITGACIPMYGKL